VKGNPYASVDSTHQDNFIPQNFAGGTGEKTISPDRRSSTGFLAIAHLARVGLIGEFSHRTVMAEYFPATIKPINQR
jgi:hypothetical protein